MAEDPMEMPSWTAEAVGIVNYGSAWAVRGAQECDQLQILLAAWRTSDVEHVGSTAVPGLAAKPILDLQASVVSLDVADAIAEVLAWHQWHYVPLHLDRRHYRRFFVKVIDGRRVVHLHLLEKDTVRWRQQLAFRDASRSDPDLIDAYVELKNQLAEQYRHDREAYSIGKSQFIADVLTGNVRGS